MDKAQIVPTSGGYKVVLTYRGNYTGRYAGKWERTGFIHKEDADGYLYMINQDITMLPDFFDPTFHKMVKVTY